MYQRTACKVNVKDKKKERNRTLFHPPPIVQKPLLSPHPSCLVCLCPSSFHPSEMATALTFIFHYNFTTRNHTPRQHLSLPTSEFPQTTSQCVCVQPVPEAHRRPMRSHTLYPNTLRFSHLCHCDGTRILPGRSEHQRCRHTGRSRVDRETECLGARGRAPPEEAESPCPQTTQRQVPVAWVLGAARPHRAPGLWPIAHIVGSGALVAWGAALQSLN